MGTSIDRSVNDFDRQARIEQIATMVINEKVNEKVIRDMLDDLSFLAERLDDPTRFAFLELCADRLGFKLSTTLNPPKPTLPPLDAVMLEKLRSIRSFGFGPVMNATASSTLSRILDRLYFREGLDSVTRLCEPLEIYEFERSNLLCYLWLNALKVAYPSGQLDKLLLAILEEHRDPDLVKAILAL